MPNSSPVLPINQQTPYNKLPIIIRIQTPNIDYEGNYYPYRKNVTARLSLTGHELRAFRGVVFGGPAPLNQLVLRCYAECESCTSSLYPQCSPIRWELSPLYDRTHNQSFQFDWSSNTLTCVVTFTIDHRPRRPKGQDPTRRCATEALSLTFSFCDYIGRTVAEQKVGPFQARLHKIKPVLPLPVASPVESVAPVNIQAPAPAPFPPCLCPDCVYKAMLHHPNG